MEERSKSLSIHRKMYNILKCDCLDLKNEQSWNSLFYSQKSQIKNTYLQLIDIPVVITLFLNHCYCCCLCLSSVYNLPCILKHALAFCSRLKSDDIYFYSIDIHHPYSHYSFCCWLCFSFSMGRLSWHVCFVPTWIFFLSKSHLLPKWLLPFMASALVNFFYNLNSV